MNQESTRFDQIGDSYEHHIGDSLKGTIRHDLLMADLEEIPDLRDAVSLSILDIGCGSAPLSATFFRRGYRLTLLDSSTHMLSRARKKLISTHNAVSPTLVHSNFLDTETKLNGQFDLVFMHGSAEWMKDPDHAITKACEQVVPGGHLSLLIFNSDRLLLKQGINGHLAPGARQHAKRKLTPPGGRSPQQVIELMNRQSGTIVRQSGIRIFQGFFRQFTNPLLSDTQWIEQERTWYRKHPFASLGEHTHFIWNKNHETE